MNHKLSSQHSMLGLHRHASETPINDISKPSKPVFSCVADNFPYAVPGQAWYLIVSIPDSCLPFYLRKLWPYSVHLYPFKPNGISRPYQLSESISNIRAVE